MPALFFVIALVYSMVGFGGGSSYIAILALFGTEYTLIPQLALLCNIIVVTGGVWHFTRKGHLSFSLLWPFVLSSIPFSFIGGRLPVSKEVYFVLLGATLLIAGARLLFFTDAKGSKDLSHRRILPALSIGAALGLLSGMLGIGGGIFLAPILLLLHWGSPKQVAATASAFIFLNSLSGLAGQMLKSGGSKLLFTYWPLLFAVFLGGQLGSRLGSGEWLPQKLIRSGTAVLVVLVGVRLLFKAG